MTPPMTDVAKIAAPLKWAHRHLAAHVSRRWIKGTGFCHSCVGHDLEKMGLVESRLRKGVREIRASDLGLAVRDLLQAERDPTGKP